MAVPKSMSYNVENCKRAKLNNATNANTPILATASLFWPLEIEEKTLIRKIGDRKLDILAIYKIFTETQQSYSIAV